MRFRPAKVEQVEADMTPMIDVVFQLIIFFMLIISFVDLDRAERIKLPVADQAFATDQLPAERITLNIDKDGDVIWVGDAYFKKSGWSGLDRQLRLHADLVERTMKIQNEDPSRGLWTTVYIRGDKRSVCKDVQKLMKVCQEHRFNKFALRAMSKAPD